MKNKHAIIVWSKAGCSYCDVIKSYLEEKGLTYQIIDVTHHDDRRDILEVKYGIRHVPVVEIGQKNEYKAVTKVGIEYVERALAIE